jgi:hypothetical protein
MSLGAKSPKYQNTLLEGISNERLGATTLNNQLEASIKLMSPNWGRLNDFRRLPDA